MPGSGIEWSPNWETDAAKPGIYNSQQQLYPSGQQYVYAGPLTAGDNPGGYSDNPQYNPNHLRDIAALQPGRDAAYAAQQAAYDVPGGWADYQNKTRLLNEQDAGIRSVQGYLSGPSTPQQDIAGELAGSLGWSAKKYGDTIGPLMQQFGEIRNPSVAQRIRLDALLGHLGISPSDPKIADWYNGVQSSLWGGGDSWSDAEHARNRGPRLEEVAKGILFGVTGAINPAAWAGGVAGMAGNELGGPLVGTLAGLGVGGIAGLSSGQSLGEVVGKGALNLGLGYGARAISGSGETARPNFTLGGTTRAGSTETTRTATNPQTATDLLTEPTTLGEEVVSSGGGGGQPESLSDAVVSYRKPKTKPQIRLTEGFRRGY